MLLRLVDFIVDHRTTRWLFPAAARGWPLAVAVYAVLVALTPGDRRLFGLGGDGFTDAALLATAALNLACALRPSAVRLVLVTTFATSWVWAGRAFALWLGEGPLTGWQQVTAGAAYALLLVGTITGAYLHVLLLVVWRGRETVRGGGE